MISLGLLVLRLVFGTGIALHGFPKLFGGQGRKVSPEAERVLGAGFSQSMERGGFNNVVGMMQRMEAPGSPQALAGAHVSAELFGGLALILGWHTRLAALALMINMATAIRKMHWEKGIMGQGGAEMAALYFGAFLALFLTGPGKLSLDRR